ncbi:Cytochrome P450 monooxygenase [Pseudocercospora fuligena]|uniref:Cytochrome P450 monooxygenase n=1 Tax=Pseudocercospora fuligena TaxID=685502 RepID=A0A8H6RVV1_9PEZI|nr:Cytochrome P450 monooxygenase [Pseudocercospora fuligena]
MDVLQSLPVSIQAICGVTVLGILYYAISGGQRPYAGFPLVTLEEQGWKTWLGGPSKTEWMAHCADLLRKGRKITNGCFQVRASSGYKIVVPNRFTDELRNHPDADFGLSMRKDMMSDYEGFDGVREGLRHDGVMLDVVRVKLTQSLGLVTQDIVDEADKAIGRLLKDDDEWTTYRIKDVLLDVVARVSTRVFAGEELANDEEWLHIAKQYTLSTFMAAQELLRRSPLTRSVAQYFEPMCTQGRKYVKEARRIIAPRAEQRMKQRDSLDAGEKKKSQNSFDWMADLSKGRYLDFSAGQLTLSVAAIHTTTEMTTRALVRLCTNPEVVQPLRDEIVGVLKEDGWAKTSLYKMKLLDSFMKEVSRMDKMGDVAMRRGLTKEITLSDGTVLPKNALILVSDSMTRDPTFYPEPEKFDAWRYLKMRQRPGEENKHQFVTTSPDNLFFGHGQHACPGRFFASNEIKILFCYFLLRYDFRLEPGTKVPESISFEDTTTVSPDIQVQARKRQGEIEIDLKSPKV